MLFLPLIYPGLILSSGFNTGCFTSVLSFTIFFVTIITKGLLEEVVFRGVVQGYLLSRYPDKTYHYSCIISSVLFALVHFTNLQYGDFRSVMQQVIYAFFVGMFFSALLIRVKNVWLLGVIHGLINFMSIACRNKLTETNEIKIAESQTTLFVQIAGVTLIFLPALFCYWILIKTAKK
jgi:membrane protease YdiL (CAAX protease family)